MSVLVAVVDAGEDVAWGTGFVVGVLFDAGGELSHGSGCVVVRLCRV